MTRHLLALDAFHGGSHRQFLDGWVATSRHTFTVLTLPGTRWKWRARHSAVWFAEQLRADPLDTGSPPPEALFCTDMLNLAEFLGLCPPFCRNLPAIVYFHESQLTYPNRSDHDRDLHFAYSNFTTALAADQLWFNSRYHRDVFLTEIRSFLRRMPDRHQLHLMDRIESKSEVQPPGVSLVDGAGRRREPGPLRIVWVSRWEFDKRPEVFFDALKDLVNRGVNFTVSVLGESCQTQPDCFRTAREWLGDRVDRWGFVASADEYRQTLSQSDVVVSTAAHEFFGIAVVEAVSAGCVPLVPDDLAYPETLGRDGVIFHDHSAADVARHLESLAQKIPADCHGIPSIDVSRYGWSVRAPAMDDRMDEIVRSRARPGKTVDT